MILDITTHSQLLSAVLSNPKNRKFTNEIKKFLWLIHDPGVDEVLSRNFIDEVLSKGISDKEEIEYKFGAVNYENKSLCRLVSNDRKYSEEFHRSLLAKLSMKLTISSLGEDIRNINDSFNEINSYQNELTAVRAYQNIQDDVLNLNVKLQKNKLTSDKTSTLIIKPSNGDEVNDLSDVAHELRVSVTNKVKTIPAMDNMWGGGLGIGLYLVGGISGYFKSGLMQNLIMYAAKNNDRDRFNIEDGYEPAVIFFSFEMQSIQCFRRTLNWLGEPEPLSEGLTEEEHARLLQEVLGRGLKKHNINTNIIYVVPSQNESGPDGSSDNESGLPDSQYISDTLDRLKVDNGIVPILIAVDYLDKMGVVNKIANRSGDSGGEGAAKTRMKAHELRQISLKYKIPVITATQLNGFAMAVVDKLAPYSKQLDVVTEFGLEMIAGSRNLRAECEDVILMHLVTVDVKGDGGDKRETAKFLAIKQDKDRDNVGVYFFSERDRLNAHAYNTYTSQIKTSVYGHLLKESSKLHVVIPLNGFRMSETDCGKSIRMFYTSDNSGYLSLSELMSGGDDMDDDMYNEVCNQLFGNEPLDITDVSPLPPLDEDVPDPSTVDINIAVPLESVAHNPQTGVVDKTVVN